MTSPLADVFPATLIATWIAWLHAALFYGALRWGEKRWPALPYWGVVPLVIYLWCDLVPWLRMYPIARVEELIRVGTYVLLAQVGCFFHRRSGGASGGQLGAFLLMFEVVNLSVMPMRYLMKTYWHTLRKVPEPGVWTWNMGVALYPAFVPLAMWIWQSMRLRQGTDVPREEE